MIIPNPKSIRFYTGETDAGWAPFTVQIGREAWTCNASYFDRHPLAYSIDAAVNLIFVECFPGTHDHKNLEESEQELSISMTDEFDNLFVKIVGLSDEIASIEIHSSMVEGGRDASDYCLFLKKKAKVNYLDFAEAVFYDAARALKRQGATTISKAWTECAWDIDQPRPSFPMSRFLYLASYVLDIHKGLSFEEELKILQLVQATEFEEAHASVTPTEY